MRLTIGLLDCRKYFESDPGEPGSDRRRTGQPVKPRRPAGCSCRAGSRDGISARADVGFDRSWPALRRRSLVLACEAARWSAIVSLPAELREGGPTKQLRTPINPSEMRSSRRRGMPSGNFRQTCSHARKGGAHHPWPLDGAPQRCLMDYADRTGPPYAAAGPEQKRHHDRA